MHFFVHCRSDHIAPFLLQASVLGPVNSNANELLLEAVGLPLGEPRNIQTLKYNFLLPEVLTVSKYAQSHSSVEDTARCYGISIRLFM